MSGTNPESGDLGIYIHVPFCKHACPYCDFYKIELRDRPARARLEFPAMLAMELRLLMAEYPDLPARPLSTIYFGGGTPSTLVPEAVGDLVAELKGAFVSADTEITLEANPENLTPERCAKWRAAGVTRLSIGVQSFAERDLKQLERLHDATAIRRAIANARAAGFGNISIDLMFALPGQSQLDWESNLTQALDLAPDHISFYGLTYHEDTPFEKWRAERRITEIDEDSQADMYLAGAALLEREGFDHYEISNFARPGFRSRHNQRYWSRADVIALGPSAHSNLGALRWHNPPDIDQWGQALALGRLPRVPTETLDDRARMEERLFTGLRRRDGFGAKDDADLYQTLSSWILEHRAVEQGWVELSEDRVSLRPEGWLICDAIIASVLKSPV